MLTPSGGYADNYEFSYESGALEITHFGADSCVIPKKTVLLAAEIAAAVIFILAAFMRFIW